MVGCQLYTIHTVVEYIDVDCLKKFTI